MKVSIRKVLATLFFLIPIGAGAQNDPSGAVKTFIENFWSQWSQPNSTAIPFITNAITDPINFYGKAISRADYVKLQVNFGKRWPARNYAMEPTTLLIVCAPNGLSCNASGIVDWTDSSPERNVTSRGSAAFNFGINMPASPTSAILITSQSGHVISRTISVYQAGQTTESTANNPPNLSSVQSAPTPATPAPVSPAPEPPAPSFANIIPDSDLASAQLKVTSWSTNWAVDEQTDSGEGLCVPVVRLTLQNLGADISSATLHVQFVNMANKTIYGEGIGFNGGIPSGFSASFIIDSDTGRPVNGMGCFDPPLLTAYVTFSDFPPGSGQNLLIAKGLVDTGGDP